MTLDNFEKKLELNKENPHIHNQIFEMLELFTDLANLELISYYKYNYEYNDFFYKFTITKDGKKIEEPKNKITLTK